jgi:hypothetical protein
VSLCCWLLTASAVGQLRDTYISFVVCTAVVGGWEVHKSIQAPMYGVFSSTTGIFPSAAVVPWMAEARLHVGLVLALVLPPGRLKKAEHPCTAARTAAAGVSC